MEERKLITFLLALSRPQTDVAKEIGSMVGVQGRGVSVESRLVRVNTGDEPHLSNLTAFLGLCCLYSIFVQTVTKHLGIQGPITHLLSVRACV